MLSLLKRGYTVFATVRKDEDVGSLKRDTERLLGGNAGELVPVIMDVCVEQTISDAVQLIMGWTALAGNRLVAVVNNAAVSESLPMELTPIEKVEQVFDTNVMGVLRVTRAVLPLLRQSGGRVVVIGSLNGDIGVPLMSSYCASKHALEGWCDAVRVELIPQGVHVALVKPGTINTPIFGKTMTETQSVTASLNPKQREVANKFYGELLEGADAFTQGLMSRAVDPAYVTMSCIHAIESKFPQTRYLVGIDAALVASVRPFVPDRIMDLILMYGFKAQVASTAMLSQRNVKHPRE